MKKRALLIAAALTLALAIVAIVLIATSTPPTVAASTKFLGFTNSATDGRLAMFAVTNLSAVPIRRWDIYNIEGQPSGIYSQSHLPANASLAPKQIEIITLAPPTNLPTWRVAFVYSAADARVKLFDWKSTPFGSHFRKMIPQKLQYVPCKRAESDWIEP